METKYDKWFTVTGQRIFEFNRKQYLTLPAAFEFIGEKRGALRQQIARNEVPQESYITENKYVFISLDYLESTRDRSKRLKRLLHLEEKLKIKFSNEDFEEFVKWKLGQKESEIHSK